MTIEQAEALAIDFLRLFLVALDIEIDKRAPETRAKASKCFRGAAEREIEKLRRLGRQDLPAEYRARRLVDTLYALNLSISITHLQAHPFSPTADQIAGLSAICRDLAGPLLRGEIH